MKTFAALSNVAVMSCPNPLPTVFIAILSEIIANNSGFSFVIHPEWKLLSPIYTLTKGLVCSITTEVSIPPTTKLLQ